MPLLTTLFGASTPLWLLVGVGILIMLIGLSSGLVNSDRDADESDSPSTHPPRR